MSAKMRRIVGNVVIWMLICLSSPICARSKSAHVAGGDTVKEYRTNAPNLIDGCDKDTALGRKLKYDVDNDATKLNDEIEIKLNKIGVFDEEINDLDKQTVKDLNRSINTQVSISYIKIDEKHKTVEDLSLTEINNEIQNQIKNKKIQCYEENVEKRMVRGSAKSEKKFRKSDDHSKNKRQLKEILYVCQFKKKGNIHVTARACWMKEAYYKNTDVFGVNVGRGDIVPNSWSCKHTAMYRYTAISPFYSTGKQKYESKPSAVKIGGSGNSLAYKVNLFGDRKKMKASASAGIIEHYENENIEIKFECRYESKKSVKFVTSYSHLETNKTVTPSIGFGSGGISVSVSSSSSQYYVNFCHNAYLLYKHI